MVRQTNIAGLQDNWSAGLLCTRENNLEQPISSGIKSYIHRT